MKNKSKKKIKNERSTFWETMLLLTLKRQDFLQIDIWFSCIASLSQWGGGGILLVQIISTCLRGGRVDGGGISTL
jgi:hypothetical protein